MPDQSLSQILEDAKLEAKKIKGKRVSKAVAMFDLSGSTPLKLAIGHTLGTRTALEQNFVCRKIAEKYKGSVVKELGDGILIIFDDALNACEAALDIETATREISNCSTKAGITFGYVEEVEINNSLDVLGTTVDRSARIQSAALPGQILVDKALYEPIASFLKDKQDIILSQPKSVDLKGIGQTEIYELSSSKLGFVGWQQPFSIEDGRLPITQKVEFMKGAGTEVIELGIGLKTFTSYFYGRKAADFKEHVIELLRQGVNLKCYLLDPKSEVAKIYAKERREPHLIQEIENTIEKLHHLEEEFAALNLKGVLEIYVYDSFPCFYVMCVDPLSDNARMTASPYMPGLLRADMPVMQFSKALNSQLFSKYWIAVQEITGKSKLMVWF